MNPPSESDSGQPDLSTSAAITVNMTHIATNDHCSAVVTDPEGNPFDGYHARFVIRRQSANCCVVIILVERPDAADNSRDLEINFGPVYFEPRKFVTHTDTGTVLQRPPTHEEVLAAALAQHCTVQVLDEDESWEIIVTSNLLTHGNVSETLDEDEAEKLGLE